MENGGVLICKHFPKKGEGWELGKGVVATTWPALKRIIPAIFAGNIFKLHSLPDKLDQSRVSCYPLSLCFPSLFHAAFPLSHFWQAL